MITKQRVFKSATILADGRIELQESDDIIEDGEVISESYHRQVIEVGEDVSGFGYDVLNDIVNGNLFTQARIDNRAAQQAIENANAEAGPPVEPGPLT